MSMFQPPGPSAYKSTYTKAITRDGNFIKFERNIEDEHLEIGCWAFNPAHERHAYEHNIVDPESILLAQLVLKATPNNIEIIWMPGKRDKFCVPRRGTALQHISQILDERNRLGLGFLPLDTVPFYPFDPDNKLLGLRQEKGYALSVAVQACLTCRRKHRRCGKEIPACARCVHSGDACGYTPDDRTSTPASGPGIDKPPKKARKSSLSKKKSPSSSQSYSSPENSNGTDSPLLGGSQAASRTAHTDNSKTTTLQEKPRELSGQGVEAQTKSRALPTLAPRPPGMSMYQSSEPSPHQYLPTENTRLLASIGTFEPNAPLSQPGHWTNHIPADYSLLPPQSAFSTASVFPHPQNLAPQVQSLLKRRSLPSHSIQLPTSPHPSQPRNLCQEDALSSASPMPPFRKTGTMQYPVETKLNESSSPAANGQRNIYMQEDEDVVMMDSNTVMHEEAQGGDEDVNMQEDGVILMQQQSSIGNSAAQTQEKDNDIQINGVIPGSQLSTVDIPDKTQNSEDTSEQPLIEHLAAASFSEESSALSHEVFSTPLPCMECGIEDGHDHGCGIGVMTRDLSASRNSQLLAHKDHGLADHVERVMRERPDTEDPERTTSLWEMLPHSPRRLEEECAYIAKFIYNDGLDNESPQSIRSGSDSSEDKGSDEESTMQTHPDPKRIDEQRLLSGGYIKVRSS